MNILQLAKYYPPVYGGIELVEKMMTKVHRESGDNVFISAFSKESKTENGEFGEIIFRINERFNILSAPFSFSFYKSFRNLIIENKINRIYVHLPNPFMHEVVFRNTTFLKNHQVEVIAVYHSDIVNKSFLGSLYNFYFSLSSSVYNRFLVSSHELWNSSHILKKISLGRQLVIPFCVEEGLSFKNDFKFKKKIISIGRLVPYKGFEFLINTLNDTDYELHIVGDGPLRESLQKIAKENIFFHYKLNHHEKNELLIKSDILLIGSINRAEAYGMSIVESFSKAIPVIAPKLNTGVNYLVQDQITGLLYDVKNSKELLEKIKLLEKDDGLYKNISDNCLEFYKKNLTYEKFKESLQNI
jgi:glycosyltransferase involved in cell wall biosynthesis